MRSRSSPSANLASTSKVSVPTSTRARGLARRLWHQSGLTGAPPLDANTARRSPSAWYITGLTRTSPLLAPVLCSNSNGAPSNGPPTLPALARNSSMIFSFQSLAMTGATTLTRQLFPVEQVEQLLGRTGDDGAVTTDYDRPLDQGRVPDHGVEKG